MQLMSRQKKAGTISALFVGLLVLIVLLANIDTRVSAIARMQNPTVTLTPCDDNVDDGECSDYRDQLTNTAELATQTATAMGTSTAGTPTATTTTTAGVGTPTVTPTPVLSPTSVTGVATLAPSPIQPTPIPTPQQLAPTETPTVIPDDALTCFPGQPVVITGDGPARAAFLLYFGQRVVSGGSVTPSGRFATTLIVGNERAGVYPVTVRVRGTAQVLLEISCAVPDVTPTLVPRARELPCGVTSDE
jgi:hypothetical protein